MIGGSGSGKTNALFNLIGNQPDKDETYLYTSDPNEAKFQMFNSTPGDVDLKEYNDSKDFV